MFLVFSMDQVVQSPKNDLFSFVHCCTDKHHIRGIYRGQGPSTPGAPKRGVAYDTRVTV